MISENQFERNTPRENPSAENSRRELIRCGISQHFHNKDNRAPERWNKRMGKMSNQWAFADFPAESLSAADFVHGRLAGQAWIPSTFKSGHRTNENWQQAQLIAVDYDNNVSVADALAVPFIRQYAMLVHPSASSGKPDEQGNPIYKTRVIFRLDSPITGDYENYRTAARAICRVLGLDDDPVSYKPAQLYYGSTNRIEQPFIQLDAVLPLALVDTLAAELRAAIAQQEAQRADDWQRMQFQTIDIHDDRAGATVERARASAFEKVRSATTDRTQAVYGQAFRLAHYLAYWPLAEDTIIRDMLDAARLNGSTAKYGEDDILRQINNGIRAGMVNPKPLSVPTRDKHGRPLPPEESHLADTLQDARELDAWKNMEPDPSLNGLMMGQGLSQSDKPDIEAEKVQLQTRKIHGDVNIPAESDPVVNSLQGSAILNSESLKLSDPPKVYTPLNRSVTPDPELRLITPSAAAHDHLPTEGELQTAHHALYGTGPLIYWILRTADRAFWTRALIVEEAQRRGLPLTNDHVDNWLTREGEYFSVSLNIELVKEYYVQNYGKVPNGRLPDHFRLRDLSECPANLFTLAQKRLKEQAVKTARQEAQDADANDPIWWDDELSQAIGDDLDISPTDADTLKNRVNTHYTRQRAEDETFRKRINRAYRKFKRPEQELADKLRASDFADFEIPDYLKGADDTPMNIYYAAFLKWYNEQNPDESISISKICRLLGISSSARALHIRKLAKLEHTDENATRFVAEIDIPADLPEDERAGYLQRQLTQLAKENEARPLRLSIEDYDAAYCGENVRTIAKAANVIYAEFRQAAPLVFKPDLPAPKKQAASASSVTITPDEPSPRRAVEHPYGMDYWPTFRQGQIREAIKSRGWTLDTGHWIDPTGQHRVNDRLALLMAFDMPVSESEIMLSIHHMSEKYEPSLRQDEPEESLPIEQSVTLRRDETPADWWTNFQAVMYPRQSRKVIA